MKVISRKVTQEALVDNWFGKSKGKLFMCFICGYKFQLGDRYHMGTTNRGNFLACDNCAKEDLETTWKQVNAEIQEFKDLYPWAFT